MSLFGLLGINAQQVPPPQLTQPQFSSYDPLIHGPVPGSQDEHRIAGQFNQNIEAAQSDQVRLFANTGDLLRAVSNSEFGPIEVQDGRLQEADTGYECDFAVDTPDGGQLIYYDLRDVGMRDAPQNDRLSAVQNQAFMAASGDAAKANIYNFDPTESGLARDGQIVAVVGQKGGQPEGVLLRLSPAAQSADSSPFLSELPQLAARLPEAA